MFPLNLTRIKNTDENKTYSIKIIDLYKSDLMFLVFCWIMNESWNEYIRKKKKNEPKKDKSKV